MQKGWARTNRTAFEQFAQMAPTQEIRNPSSRDLHHWARASLFTGKLIICPEQWWRQHSPNLVALKGPRLSSKNKHPLLPTPRPYGGRKKTDGTGRYHSGEGSKLIAKV